MEVIFAQTIFPALCRVKDSVEGLSEMIAKASRAAMIFFIAGSGILLIFPNQVIRFLLTERWEGAELFLRAQGASLLFGAMAFNWEALFRAVGQTQPIFRTAVIYGTAFFAILCPLAFGFGATGVAVGLVVCNVIAFAARNYYFNRLRLHTSMAAILWRSFVALGVAIASVVLLRGFRGDARTWREWAMELTVYLVTFGLAILWLERKLFSELTLIIINRQDEGRSHGRLTYLPDRNR